MFAYFDNNHILFRFFGSLKIYIFYFVKIS